MENINKIRGPENIEKIKIKSLKIYDINENKNRDTEDNIEISHDWVKSYDKLNMIKYIVIFDKKTRESKLFLDLEFEKNKHSHGELSKIILNSFSDDIFDGDIIMDGSLLSVSYGEVYFYESFNQSMNAGGEISELTEELKRILES